MTPDLHGLVSQMADELDRCQQLLLDDRRVTHALATEARAVLDRWGNHPGSPDSSDGPAVPDGREPASVAMQPSDEKLDDWHSRCADLTRLGEAEHYWAFDLQGDDVAAVARAALSRWGRQPAPPAEGEVPQGWHMLCDIEPEPGTMCDWVIMAPWGCDHGSGEWRHFDSSPVPEFFDLPAGCGVHGKGFADKHGLMLSDPKSTAWRARPLPAPEGEEVQANG